MPFFFASGFSKGKKGPSPETLAMRNARIFLNNKKAANYGALTDPKVYEEAINKYLDPYSDDSTVQQMISQFQSDGAALSAKQNDEEYKTNVLTQNLMERSLELGKKLKDSPGDIAVQTTALYDDAIRKLRQEAEVNRLSGGSYGRLEAEVKRLEPIKYKLSQLASSVVAGNSEETRKTSGNFGYYIDSDPTTGKIISMQLLPTDEGSKGFMRSDSFYGNVPVYVKGTRNPYNGNQLMAKVGNSTFKGESVQTDTGDTASGALNQTVLKLENPKKLDLSGVEQIKNVLRTGDTQHQFDVNKGAFDLDLSGATFVDNVYNDVPPNTILRDTSRNIWLKNNDGKFIKFPNADVAAEALGQPKDLLEQNVKDITNADTQGFSDYQLYKDIQSPGQATSSGASASVAPTRPANVPVPGDGNFVGPTLPYGPKAPTKAPAEQQPRGAEKQKKTTENITSGGLAQTLKTTFNKLNPFA